MIRKFTFLLAICLHFCLSAQNLFPVTTIHVLNHTKDILNPWAGGMNNPELSPIDLNRDSIKDLFIFDKDGYKTTCFLNMGRPDTPMFFYAPIYQKNFPEMTKLALVRDYNQDGVDDIYTSATAGLKLLKGSYLGGTQFNYQVIDSPLVFSTSGIEVNLYNANDDIPAIRDMDNDGDLDILVNSIFGQTYEFYKNMSVELYGHPDTSTYILDNTCRGHFIEDAFRNNLLIGACKTDHASSATRDTVGSYRHSGCTIELFDQDNDADVDILLGDPNYKAIVYGENGGTSTAANIISEDTLFPSYNSKIDVTIFPATFYLDVDNDNRQDIIAAPNITQTSLDVGNVWYYKCTGADTNKQFSLQTDSFLVGDMIDVGKNAKPLFFDYNSDTLIDILISNLGYFNKSTGLNESKLTLYKNIGTVDTPKFELITRDYQGLFALGLNDMKHTLGDLDADGDADMILGDVDGKIHVFTNTPSAGNANFTGVAPLINYQSIDVGINANPCLHDIDNDGDLDLLVGRIDGKINYYWNFGSPSVYKFHKDSVNTNFGFIDVLNTTTSPDGNASPYVKDSIVYVGSQSGAIFTYKINVDSLRRGTLALISNKYADIRDGYNTNICIADLNNDGLLEYLTGNSRGGLTLYSQANWDTIIAPRYLLSVKELEEANLDITIYPNPANEQFTISYPNFELYPSQLSIYNIKGQVIYNKPINEAKTIVNVRDLEAGMYFIRLANEKKSITKKIIIHK